MNTQEKELATKLCRLIDENNQLYRDAFIRRVDKSYRSYRGFMRLTSDAARWSSKIAPKYTFQIIETIKANLFDPTLKMDVQPVPIMADQTDVETLKLAARAAGLLLDHSNGIDDYIYQQAASIQQASIAGITAQMVSYDFEQKEVERYQTNPVVYFDEDGQVVTSVPERQSEKVKINVIDDPVCKTLNVKDIMWPYGATDLQTAQYFARCYWLRPDQLRKYAALGIFKNTDEVADTSRGVGDMPSTTSSGLIAEFPGMGYAKDLIECWEFWWEELPGQESRVQVIANKQIIIRDDPNPYNHYYLRSRKPFVIARSIPDLFLIPGISDVELVEDLQEGLWSIKNQRLDNLTLINNAIMLISDRVKDPEKMVWEPGARWIVGTPEDVQSLNINPMPAEISAAAEADFMNDMQNVTGGLPFMSGQSQTVIDQTTATGVSIVSNLAQLRLQMKQEEFARATRQVAEQKISLYQQFLDKEKMVSVGGSKSMAFFQVVPDMIQNLYCKFKTRGVGESLNRQEKRAEAQALFTTLGQLAPLAVQMGVTVDLVKLGIRYLEAYDIDDPESYIYATPKQPQPQQAALPPGGQAALNPAPAGGTGAGVTSPLATSSATSPSNALSAAPSQFSQRMLAASGGSNNGPAQ